MGNFPSVDPRIELSKKSAVDNMELFLRNFSKVPDDRLDWTPTPTSKSAIRIAAHTALYAGRFAQMISDRALPKVENLDQWLSQRNAEEELLTVRVEVEAVFREGTAQVISALESLTPVEIESTLDSGQGWQMSMIWVMGLPGWHSTLHTGQIDYLQTCWGDQEIYVG
jgi:hypothetical protein